MLTKHLFIAQEREEMCVSHWYELQALFCNRRGSVKSYGNLKRIRYKL